MLELGGEKHVHGAHQDLSLSILQHLEVHKHTHLQGGTFIYLSNFYRFLLGHLRLIKNLIQIESI